jgi:hypothetical protein
MSLFHARDNRTRRLVAFLQRRRRTRAAAALDKDTLRRVVPYGVVTFKNLAVPIQELKLQRP